MALDEPHYLDAVDSRGVGVRIQFSSTGDRYSHTIYGIDNGIAEAVLVSLDDLGLTAELAIPTWQEVREIDVSGAKVLALVGSASGMHWSASISCRQLLDEAALLEFDFAVRLQAQLPLAFAYRAMEGTTWVDFPGALAFARTESSSVAIMSPLNLDPDLPDLANKLRISSLAEHGDCRVFEPTLPTPRVYPATLRWRYWIGGPMV